MRKIDLVQGSEQWIAWRREGITATDIAAIMGVCPYNKPKDIALKKMGLESTYVNAAMKRGHDYEAAARDYVNTHTPHQFVDACYQHDELPWVRASLDGIDGDTLLEIKIPSEKNFGVLNTIPIHHYYQIQWQMLASGATSGIYAVYSPELVTAEMLPVERDDKLIDEMLKAAKEFMAMDKDALIKEELLVERDLRWELCADRLWQTKQKKKELEKEEKHLEKELKELSNGVSSQAGIFRYVKNVTKGSVDYKAIPELNGVDLEQYRKGDSERWVLRIKEKD